MAPPHLTSPTKGEEPLRPSLCSFLEKGDRDMINGPFNITPSRFMEDDRRRRYMAVWVGCRGRASGGAASLDERTRAAACGQVCYREAPHTFCGGASNDAGRACRISGRDWS